MQDNNMTNNEKQFINDLKKLLDEYCVTLRTTNVNDKPELTVTTPGGDETCGICLKFNNDGWSSGINYDEELEELNEFDDGLDEFDDGLNEFFETLHKPKLITREEFFNSNTNITIRKQLKIF